MNSLDLRATITALFVAATPALMGAIVLDVGEHVLLPETSGQQVILYYRTDDPATPSLAGSDFVLEIRPIGATMSPVQPMPSVTAVNLLENTPFAGFGATQTGDVGNSGQLQIWNVNVPPRGVYPELPLGAPTRIATLTIDTSGIAGGTFELLLKDTAVGTTSLWDPSGFQPLDLRIQNGTLVVVPEMSGMFSVAVFLVLGGCVRWMLRK